MTRPIAGCPPPCTWRWSWTGRCSSRGEVGVGKTEVAKVLAAVFGRQLIRLQCYEGIDTSQALYEWDYARQTRCTSGRCPSARSPTSRRWKSCSAPEFLLERPLLAIRAGDRAVLLIDEVDGADYESEVFPVRPCRPTSRSASPRSARSWAEAAAAGGGAHLQPDQGTPRRAETALPLPLDRLPAAGHRDRDRADPGARRVRGADPQGSRRGQPAPGSLTWPSRRAWRRPSTGPGPWTSSAPPS